MLKITDYEPIVGAHTIEELRILAGKLQGKVIQNINSTAVGGGVAEILNRMVPLLQELGWMPDGILSKAARASSTPQRNFTTRFMESLKKLLHKCLKSSWRQAREILTKSRFMVTSCSFMTHNPLSWLRKRTPCLIANGSGGVISMSQRQTNRYGIFSHLLFINMMALFFLPRVFRSPCPSGNF